MTCSRTEHGRITAQHASPSVAWIPTCVVCSQGAWKEAIYDSSQPHAETLPAPFDK
jgi:hypothetical protein